MKIISWNTREIGDQSKKLALKRMILKTNSELVLIQETKKEAIELEIIKAVWGSKDIVFMLKLTKSLGGLLNMWDKSKISVLESLKEGHSLSVKCKTLNRKVCWVTNIHGPPDYRERRFIWPESASLSAYCTNPWGMGEIST